MSVHMSDPKIIPFPEKDFPLKRIADAFSVARREADGMNESDRIGYAAKALIKAYPRDPVEHAKRLEPDSAFPEFAKKVTLRVAELSEKTGD